MTTALLAEDEPLLAQALGRELSALWPELQIVAVASDGLQASRLLLEKRPDVAFLDIRMAGRSGIEVAQQLALDWPDETPPMIVFVTAYDEFAVEAFRREAVDYLLKPVSAERLAEAVRRLKARLQARGQRRGGGPALGVSDRDTLAMLAERLHHMLAGGQATSQPGRIDADAGEPLRVIRAGVGNMVRMVHVSDVIFLQATDKYVNVVTADGEMLIREALRELLPRLDATRFVRVHRGTVVNLDHVQAAIRDDSGRLSLQMAGRDERVPVSRLHASLFKAM